MLKPKRNVTSNEDGSVIMQGEEKGEGTNLNELRCSNAEKGGHVQNFSTTQKVFFLTGPREMSRPVREYLSFFSYQTFDRCGNACGCQEPYIHIHAYISN